MTEKTLSPKLKKILRRAQRSEITEHVVYKRLAKVTKDKNNAKVLEKIANEEKGHHDFWAKYTEQEVSPSAIKVFVFFWTARLLGLTFGLKLMERGENNAQLNYEKIAKDIPEAKKIKEDEERHENELIDMIEESRLSYMGSVVLGLNDALVELTGALAGLTFAFQNTQMIALAGFVTGIAASMSMAASEYLSTKADGDDDAVVSSAYTGVAYFVTVLLLVAPYLIFENYIICLIATLIIAIVIIAVFNFYISVAKGYSFKKRFSEMAVISMGVAALSFGIGIVMRMFFGIDL